MILHLLADSLRSSGTTDHQSSLPAWLGHCLWLIDPPSWANTKDGLDFELRCKLFELLLYLCVRSASMIEQHAAVFGRAVEKNGGVATMHTKSGEKQKYQQPQQQKTTTTVLLKPFLSLADLHQIEKDGFYRV